MCPRRNRFVEHLENLMRAVIVTAVIGFGVACFRLGQLDMITTPRMFRAM